MAKNSSHWLVVVPRIYLYAFIDPCLYTIRNFEGVWDEGSLNATLLLLGRYNHHWPFPSKKKKKKKKKKHLVPFDLFYFFFISLIFPSKQIFWQIYPISNPKRIPGTIITIKVIKIMPLPLIFAFFDTQNKCIASAYITNTKKVLFFTWFFAQNDHQIRGYRIHLKVPPPRRSTCQVRYDVWFNVQYFLLDCN